MTGFKHGYRNTKVYSIVECVIRRCHDPKKDNFQNYGANGIFVCDEWRHDRGVFCKWLEDQGYREGLQIDRIDNDKGYSPDNCRLIPHSFNGINKKGCGVSGICGVYFKKDCTLRPYLATVRLYGKTYDIGRYLNIEEAALVRKRVSASVCEKVADLCFKHKDIPIKQMENLFVEVLVTEIQAVKGDTI